jgi:DNA-binding CsgD family transcriptional regulator
MTRSSPRRDTFTGRYDRLRALSRALDDSAARGVVRCVISGEAGIGRSAVLGAFTRACRARGGAVITLAGHPGDRHGSRGLADTLVVALAADPAGARLAEAAPAGGAGPTPAPGEPHPHPHPDPHPAPETPPDAVPVTPLRDAPGCPGHPGPGAAQPPTAALRDAVAALGAGTPLVLALDDANHADAALLGSVQRVVEAAAGLPLLVLLTERAGEPPRAPAEYAELTLGADRSELGGLSPRETGELLRARLGARPGPGLADACHRLTAGNPALLTALAAALRDAGPAPGPADLDGVVLPAVTDLLVGRAARLTPYAARLAEAVAVAGATGGAEPALVAHLSGLGLVETLTGLDTLARARLVADGDDLALRHPLLGQSLLGAMTRLARNAAHLTAASYLHDRHAPPERVAHHLSASTVPQHGGWPVPVLLSAATAAREAGHPDTARRYLETAADAASGDERRRALLELADLRLHHDPASGPRHLVAMLHHAGDDTVRRGLLARLGQALTHGSPAVLDAAGAALRGTPFEEWTHLHQVLSRLPDLPPIVAAGLFDDLPASLRPDGTAAPGASADAGPLPAVARAVAAFYRHLVDEDPGRAAGWAREALAHGGAGLDVHPPALAAALTVLVEGGHPAEAADRLERLGGPAGRPDLLCVAGQIAVAQGDLGTARRLLTASLDALGTAEPPGRPAALRAAAAGLLANVLLGQGEPAEAQALVRAGGWLGRLPAGVWHQDLLLARARLAAGNGDLATAARELDALCARARQGGMRATGTASWRSHGAELLEQAGLVSEARALAEGQDRFARATGSPLELGRAQRALARVAAPEAAEALLREAVTALESAPLELAAALADLGALAARQGRREESVGALTRAVRLAERCGAGDLALRARQQILAASDDPAQHASLRGVLSLTPREREILVDAMRGLTNRRISASRAITSRTVELHLSSAYRKLGISGRDDFPVVFRAPGLWTLLSGGPAARRRAPAHRSWNHAAAPRASVHGGESFGADRDARPHRRGPDWAGATR